LKNILGTTAPNSPTDDYDGVGGDDNLTIDGVRIVANEYDPFQDLESLVTGNFPPSPLRGDTSLTNNNAPGAVFGSSNSRSSATQEEKKEDSERDTTAAVGVDVVSKTWAIFDKLCASAPEPTIHHLTTSSIVSYPNGRHHKETLVENGTVTSPSSLRATKNSGSYPSKYTSSSLVLNKENKSRRTSIPTSPTQDHENFEVVLDPTSFQIDDEDGGGVNANYPSLKQRRWPFVGNQHHQHKQQHQQHLKQEEQQQQQYQNNATTPAPSQTAVPSAMQPLPPAEEELTDTTYGSLIPDVNLSINEDPSLQQSNEGANTIEEEEETEEMKEITVEEIAATTTKITDTKKSLVKRSWKSCKKLIAKAGHVGGTITRDHRKQQQHHPAEVDDEAQHARSLELQQERATEITTDGAVVLEDENFQEGETRETKRMLSSTTDVWNSIVASIAETFDPKIPLVPHRSLVKDDPSAAIESKEEEKASEQVNEEEFKRDGDGLTESEAQSSLNPQGLYQPKPSASGGGWKKLKAIRKSAKNVLVPTVKKEIPVKRESLSKPAPLLKAAATEKALPDPVPLEKPSELPPEKPRAVWKAVKDKDSGKTYYYHRTTRETTWKKPNDYEKFEADLKQWRVVTALQNKGTSYPEGKKNSPEKKVAPLMQEGDESLPADHPSSPSVALWPSTNPKSDGDGELVVIRNPTTAPTRSDNTVILTMTEPIAALKQPKSEEVNNIAQVWEKRNEVERLLKSLPSDDSRPSLDKLMQEYAGREVVLVKELRAKVEALPLDETQPFDEPLSMEARKRSLRLNRSSSPHRLNQRTMTVVSKASATTRSSALTDRTEKIKNTGKEKLTSFVPITETLSSTTTLSASIEDRYRNTTSTPPAGRVPSKVPVPRERQLMVEELTDSRISAESYEGNGGKRGRIVRGRAKDHVPSHQLDTIYDGDNDTDGDNTTSFDNDTYGTDSVSALSENDTDFLHRKDNFEQARRRALDDAIEREDWDLAAALSEGMRAANLPGGYARAHSSWNQTELDKFIANNDWSAVKRYIARMREKSQASTNKSIGAKSQLQHKELMSESSWTTSDSQSSFDSYDSESEA
jgi:hypothetical protein